jgi:ribosomal protein S18 acetylase RimI-like enzyme
MTFDLQRARPEHRDFLADCFLRAMRESITASRGIWDEGRERAQFLSQLEGGETRVIRLGALDVGFLTLVRGDHAVELHTLCLSPGHQGLGLGSAVVRRVLGEERLRGLELSVLNVNVRARALYERLGFEVIARTEHHTRMRFSPAASPRPPPQR